MRRVVWIGIAVVVLGGLWTLLPSVLVQQQLASTLQEHLQAAGRLDVRARATAPELLRGVVAYVTVSASRVRMGEMTAESLNAKLQRVRFRRTQGGAIEITGVESGRVEVKISQADLAAYLTQRGVDGASVTIDPSGVSASGNLRAGPVLAPVRLRGQFAVLDAVDLFFRVESVDVSGLTVPGAVVTAMLSGSDQPIVSLRRLPLPVIIDGVTSTEGYVVVAARVQSLP